jgi:hypothetical protein
VIVYFIVRDFQSKEVVKSVLVGAFMLSVFMVLYLANYVGSNENVEGGRLDYFATRLGYKGVSREQLAGKLQDYYFRTELYNPFVFMLFIFTSVFFASFSIRKYWLYFVWFFFTLGVFLLFVIVPGTHVYNMYIPLFLLAGIGIWKVIRLFPSYFKVIPIAFVTLILGFLYYQSYLLFVDVSSEYPFEREVIYKYITRTYSHKNLTNNVIGFPMRRNWKEVASFIDSHKKTSDEVVKFVTNENKTIASFYVDALYGMSRNGYYALGVKRPLSFATDYKFPQIKNKHTVHEVIGAEGNTLVRIYWVEPEQDESD